MDLKREDLALERAAAKKAIEGFPPLTRAWRFEDSPASPASAGYAYLKKVEHCDIFVLVLGKEITPPVIREYWRARKHNKPRLVFLKKCERTPVALKFVETIRGEVKYAEFNQANDLNRLIWQAVGALLIDGVRHYKLAANDVIVLTAFLAQLPKIEFEKTQPRIQLAEPEPVSMLTESTSSLKHASPSGKIAFTVGEKGTEGPSIWMMSADGSNAQKILNYASEPTVSPDGNKIAFYSWSRGIFIAYVDGPNPQKAMGGTNFYRSPDGGSWGIWIMNIDGTNPHKIIDNVPPIMGSYDRISVSR